MDHYLKRELYERVRTDPSIFEFLKSGSLDGLWYWDIENPSEEWMSPRFKAVFGYEDEEVPNTSSWWQEHIHPEDLAVALDNFQKHCEDPEHPYDQIVRYRHKDGSTVWVRCRGLAIRNEAGAPIRMLGAHSDVTALKEAEEALTQKAEQLERANAGLRDFAAAVGHDLREPLRMVTSFLDLLAERYEGKGDAEGDQYFGFARDGARRLSAMFEGLLELAKVRTEEQPRVEIDLAYLIRGVQADLGEAIARRDAVIELGELPTVIGRPTQIQRVFLNLIGNSLKFAHPERRPKIEISGRRVDSRVILRVRDNGLGFKAGTSERAFRMFKRVHDARSIEGHGIGLALVRRIVEDHAGTIRCESEEGQGSCFEIDLPAEKP